MRIGICQLEGKFMLVLHAYPYVWIVERYIRQRRGKGLGRCSPTQGAGVGVGKINVCSGRLVCKGWILCGVVNVVALNTFKEHSKTTSDYCRFLPAKTVGEAYSRLPSVVLVVHHSTGEAIDAGLADAIEIERRTIELRERCRVQGAAAVCIEGVRQ